MPPRRGPGCQETPEPRPRGGPAPPAARGPRTAAGPRNAGTRPRPIGRRPTPSAVGLPFRPEPVQVPGGEGRRSVVAVQERDEVGGVDTVGGPDPAALGAADHQPLPAGAAQVADGDRADRAQRFVHHRSPLVRTMRRWRCQGSRCRRSPPPAGTVPTVCQRSPGRSRPLGTVRREGGCRSSRRRRRSAPAGILTLHGEGPVGGSCAARAHLELQRSVLLGKPDAYLSLQIRELRGGEDLVEDETMAVHPEHPAGTRPRSRLRLGPRPAPHPGHS